MSGLAMPDALATAMRGTLTAPGDADYDERRALHNAMIDRRPALIARCTDAADVIAAIGDEGQDRVRASYRDHYDRLAGIKAVYDPENVFRVNQNILPAG